jgi:hypothetical protein
VQRYRLDRCSQLATVSVKNVAAPARYWNSDPALLFRLRQQEFAAHALKVDESRTCSDETDERYEKEQAETTFLSA